MKALDRVPKATGDQAEFTALAPLAAAGIGVFTVVAGGLATVGGATERVIRNHRGWATAALIGLTLSLALAVASTVSRDTNYVKNNKRLKQWLLNLIATFRVGDPEPACNEALEKQHVVLGCVMVPMPAPDTQPHLALTADGDPATGVLGVKVKQSGVKLTESVSVQVLGTVDGKPNVAIYRAVLTSD